MADKITCPKPLSIAVEELYEGKVKIIQTQKMRSKENPSGLPHF